VFYWRQKITSGVFEPLSERLKIPYFTWRSFRRSFAAALAGAGVELEIIEKVLGHSTTEMSVHYRDKLRVKQLAMSRFEEVYDGCGRGG